MAEVTRHAQMTETVSTVRRTQEQRLSAQEALLEGMTQELATMFVSLESLVRWQQKQPEDSGAKVIVQLDNPLFEAEGGLHVASHG